MPFVHLKVFGTTLAPQQLGRIQCALTGLMASVLHKKKALTVVQVEVLRDSDLFCGGERPPARWSAQLTAYVTQGTNTAEQKASFQAQAHALLCDELGEPSTPVYIIVQQVPAADWGYGGVTQAARAAGPAVDPQHRVSGEPLDRAAVHA